MNVLFIVVLFGKKPSDSTTLNSLKSLISNNDFNLVLVNNGPKKLNENERFFCHIKSLSKSCYCFNFLENRSLSKIYNKMFTDFPTYDRYVLLDDDTEINLEYLSVVFSKNNYDFHILTPLIIGNGVSYYPKLSGEIVRNKGREFDNSDDFLTVGSGLIINKHLIKILTENQLLPFDENFALYGVDFSLFKRLKKLSKKGVNIKYQTAGYLHHNLSKTQQGYVEWRHIERLYDVVLTVKYYSKTVFHQLYFLGRILFNEFLNKRFHLLPLVVKIFFRGKHPRC
ncbi:hypothetical protein AAHW98_08195 [Klebsiella variicola subsp. variicola]|uniref:hypothetical protein n=1 Tax=Klebsiella variicola TaxID=244366 RepID=UPI0035A8A09A